MRTRSQRRKKEQAQQQKIQQKKSKSKPKKSAKKQTKQSAKKQQKSVPAKKQTSKSVAKPQKSAEKKKKVLKKAKPAKQGYTKAQKAQFKELFDKYMSMSAQTLKNILAANAQTKTGNKDILAQRCADGKLLGKIPTCTSCGGGRFRFDMNTGIYKCPGYMDDDAFKNCGKKYQMNEFVREPWTQP